LKPAIVMPGFWERQMRLAFLVVLTLASAAHAASFAVTSLTDGADATPGDGICAAAAGGCTLRAAIQEANALAGPDAITVPAGALRLTLGDLGVTDDLTLTGAGSSATIISATRGARVLTIADSAHVTISGMQLQRGSVNWGGGLRNDGTATLNDFVFARNKAPGAPGVGYAGAVYTDGILQLTNVTFTQNATSGITGSFGGGLFNDGSAMLSNVAFTANRAGGCGGGVYNRGSVMLTAVNLTSNLASNSGGAIFNEIGTVTLSTVTISGNRANKLGGGIFNYDTVALINTTITGNRGYNGGGIFNSYGTVALTNVTVSANRSFYGGGLYNQYLFNEGAITLKNTIVNGNRPQNCSNTPMTSLGHNLDSDASCALTAAGDLSNVDPGLGPLRNNGGFTPTMALSPGSPAVDAGDNNGCPSSDQCGEQRPADGNGDGIAICDIGAYELQP